MNTRKRLIVVVSALFVSTLTSFVSAKEFGTFVPMREKGAATYYVTTEISGVGALDFMVDTGSSFATINEETLVALVQQQRADYIRNMDGVLADGSRVTLPVFSIHSLNIGGQCTLRDIRVVVFPGKTRQILGLNALRQAAPFIFSMNPPQLILSNCISSIAEAQPGVTSPPEPPPEAAGQDSVGSPS